MGGRLLSNSENREQLINFGNVYCVVANPNKVLAWDQAKNIIIITPDLRLIKFRTRQQTTKPS